MTTSKPPYIACDEVLIEIERLPTAIAYDRSLADEARTFHANAQTPVLVLFAPCSATGPVAQGLACPGSALTPSPPPRLQSQRERPQRRPRAGAPATTPAPRSARRHQRRARAAPDGPSLDARTAASTVDREEAGPLPAED